jgi:hypothetical protein
MIRNHGVLVAIATGVAIAGTSYAASAVLFRNSGIVQPPPVEVKTSPQAIATESPALPREDTTPPVKVDDQKQSTDAVSDPEPTADLKPVYAESQANPALAQAILKELPGYPCAEDASTEMADVRYFYTFADLNQDGDQEAIAYLVGSYACGTGGCTALIFDADGSDYTLNSRITVARTPIVVTDQQTEGWRDLVIPVSGGGATPGYHVVRWNGTAYAANPSVAPEWTEPTLKGTALIADEITADTPAPKLANDTCTP